MFGLDPEGTHKVKHRLKYLQSRLYLYAPNSDHVEQAKNDKVLTLRMFLYQNNSRKFTLARTYNGHPKNQEASVHIWFEPNNNIKSVSCVLAKDPNPKFSKITKYEGSG